MFEARPGEGQLQDQKKQGTTMSHVGYETGAGLLHPNLYIQMWRHLLCYRFSVCFALKFAPQRGDGKKREGVKISKQSTQNTELLTS